MSDYKESAVSGQQHTRCNRVTIINPLGGQATVIFDEETVVTVGDFIARTGASQVSVEFNPATEVPLLDPSTLQPTGQTITHAQIYQALFSAYIARAIERDNTPTA